MNYPFPIKISAVSGGTGSIYRTYIVTNYTPITGSNSGSFTGSYSSSILNVKFNAGVSTAVLDGDILSFTRHSGSISSYYQLNNVTKGTSSVEYRVFLDKPWNMRTDLVNVTGSGPSSGITANRFVSITNILKT
jgi:hypothetical protein